MVVVVARSMGLEGRKVEESGRCAQQCRMGGRGPSPQNKCLDRAFQPLGVVAISYLVVHRLGKQKSTPVLRFACRYLWVCMYV